jgi:hypothetical protein
VAGQRLLEVGGCGLVGPQQAAAAGQPGQRLGGASQLLEGGQGPVAASGRPLRTAASTRSGTV